MVLPGRAPPDTSSPLSTDSMLLLFLLVHQHSHGENPFRNALCLFSDERENRGTASFQVNLEKLYSALCRYHTSSYTCNRFCVYHTCFVNTQNLQKNLWMPFSLTPALCHIAWILYMNSQKFGYSQNILLYLQYMDHEHICVFL